MVVEVEERVRKRVRKKKKIQLVKLETERADEITCKNCDNFYRIPNTKLGICGLTKEAKYETERCDNFKAKELGESVIKIADVDLIAESYELYKREIDLIVNKANLLRDVIINLATKNTKDTMFNFKTEVLNGSKYAVIVSRVKSCRLDTKAVKEYLKNKGILDNFLKESEFFRVEIKRK
jgi:hypothetical protein